MTISRTFTEDGVVFHVRCDSAGRLNGEYVVLPIERRDGWHLPPAIFLAAGSARGYSKVVCTRALNTFLREYGPRGSGEVRQDEFSRISLSDVLKLVLRPEFPVEYHQIPNAGPKELAVLMDVMPRLSEYLARLAPPSASGPRA